MHEKKMRMISTIVSNSAVPTCMMYDFLLMGRVSYFAAVLIMECYNKKRLL